MLENGSPTTMDRYSLPTTRIMTVGIKIVQLNSEGVGGSSTAIMLISMVSTSLEDL